VTSSTEENADGQALPGPALPDYRVISLIVACAIFMEQMDATVLATALPTMARDFHVRPPAMSIAMTSYLLALAILIPVSGKVADRFGGKRVFDASILVFVLGSPVSAAAWWSTACCPASATRYARSSARTGRSR
jgi:MFS family permease